eukprot:CAMPEP_0205832232 /NCGR_PEP_ID=MMETSP0206-20130828/46424_1 /ASSEMBLY_ACC=CAM_ASM_000279 /TAXON_ID=36767 /ORGANISM="Euplotes focardii, Strain TN1" /LENGTH=90 /DNA_ID=CAMNT_0053137583 /DNA_START=69 /DNA_END=338 /DNA_ORIENTATION=+
MKQQFMQQQQMAQMQEEQLQQEQMYDVDKIDEEENEESPMKATSEGALNGEIRDHERPTEESGEDGQVIQNQMQQDTEEGIYENNENENE